jgi:hypothetical protein
MLPFSSSLPNYLSSTTQATCRPDLSIPSITQTARQQDTNPTSLAHQTTTNLPSFNQFAMGQPPSNQAMHPPASTTGLGVDDAADASLKRKDRPWDNHASSPAPTAADYKLAEYKWMLDSRQAAPTGMTHTFSVKWIKPQLAVTGPYQRWRLA